MLHTMHFFQRTGLFVLLLMAVSCQSNVPNHKYELRNGDVLFCGTTQSDLSDAINVVTQTQEGHNYSHMGILSVENDMATVIHAYPGKGVCEEPLDTFIAQRKAEGSSTYSYRIKDLKGDVAIEAVEIARSLLGRPYNDSYIITSDRQEDYYCSQLVYEAYAPEETFNLHPMNFKAPETDEFYDTWLEYYQELGIEIPQDQLGCNPNKMATNERLLFVGELPLADSTLLKY